MMESLDFNDLEDSGGKQLDGDGIAESLDSGDSVESGQGGRARVLKTGLVKRHGTFKSTYRKPSDHCGMVETFDFEDSGRAGRAWVSKTALVKSLGPLKDLQDARIAC